jgi:hypothetical protein
MGRRPVVENLRKDVRERLELVRSKFADLKHHTWKPKRHVPDISEAVALLSKRTGIGESTLWNSKTPYLADIKRLLTVWEGECKQLVARDTMRDIPLDESEVPVKGRPAIYLPKLLDELNRAREDLERERAAHRAARERIAWLEKERRVLELELRNSADELKATRETIHVLQWGGPARS